MLRTLAPDSIDAVSPHRRISAPETTAPVRTELGTEQHVDEWVANLRAVSHEIARVLVPDRVRTGSTSATSIAAVAAWEHRRSRSCSARSGWCRALLADGWIVRNRVAWIKTTPMPSPVTDRLTSGWEYLYHLVRQPNYFYDLDAIRVPLVSKPRRPSVTSAATEALGALASPRVGLARLAAEGRSGHVLGKNPTDVWALPPGRRVGDHRATFPEALVRRPILATAPPVVCTKCGRAWRRSKRRVQFLEGVPQPRPFVACLCRAPTRHGLVLDPFCGSGTTLRVARELRRDGLGIELSSRFAALARERAGFTKTLADAA